MNNKFSTVNDNKKNKKIRSNSFNNFSRSFSASPNASPRILSSRSRVLSSSPRIYRVSPRTDTEDESISATSTATSSPSWSPRDINLLNSESDMLTTISYEKVIDILATNVKLCEPRLLYPLDQDKDAIHITEDQLLELQLLISQMKVIQNAVKKIDRRSKSFIETYCKKRKKIRKKSLEELKHMISNDLIKEKHCFNEECRKNNIHVEDCFLNKPKSELINDLSCLSCKIKLKEIKEIIENFISENISEKS